MADSTINFVPPGPVAKAFMESRADVRVLLGPVGSGKTVPAFITILAHAMTQPLGADGKRRSRWGVIRNTYRDLVGATLKTYLDWVPRDYGKVTMSSPIVHHIQQGELDCEILFFPLDTEADAERLRSFEFTGIFFDEVSEIPFEILQAAIARVGRYPSMRNGGSNWSGLLLSSNMVDPDHYIALKYQNPPPTWKFFLQPGGLDPNAENTQFLQAGYYQRLIDSNDEDWVRRFVHAQFVPRRTGKVVFPDFRDSVHVAAEKITPSPNLGVVLGLDFGLTPACCFCQQQADGSIVVFDELVADNVGLQRFAQTLSTYWKQHYSHLTVIGAYGDPAGTARSTDTERTAFDVFNAQTPWKWRPAQTNEISRRPEAVSYFLRTMVDGKPSFRLSPNCSVIRAGFNGKYVYQPVQSANGTTWHDTPSKGSASHIQDAMQYALLGLGGADLVVGKDRRQGNRPRMAEDVNYQVLGDDRAPSNPQKVGTRWGEPTRATYRNDQSRSGTARGTEYNIFD